jgi:hypothetical protein
MGRKQGDTVHRERQVDALGDQVHLTIGRRPQGCHAREIEEMPRKEPGFAERLQTSAKAKQAQLHKIRATTLANDPRVAERQAARVEAAEARKMRAAEQKKANRATAELKEAQRAAEKARQAQAVAEEQTRRDAERAAREDADAALKQVQKAARDAKYAARKARQK